MSRMVGEYDRINIAMCRGQSPRWSATPANQPLIAFDPIIFFQLLDANVWRLPDDPVWSVETIGL